MTHKKWKVFERLVAAIHIAKSRGAKVAWNDHINGRQFDVTICFKHGFYEYLTVIECKDYRRQVPVEDVESFVTKSIDVKANKAIMVSSSGFQEGCIKVADRHNIDLFTLEQINRVSEETLSTELSPALNIYDVQLHTPGSPSVVSLPEEKNILPYLMQNLLIRSSDKTISLGRLVEANLSRLMEVSDENERTCKISVLADCKAYDPVLDREIEISAVSFKYRLISARILKGPLLDPFLIQKAEVAYEYSNVIKGTKETIPLDQLKLGFDTILEEGKFYINPKLEFTYYCDRIEAGMATMYLVESYQHGMLIQCVFQQKIIYEGYYLEVTDPVEIARLNKLLTKMKRSSDYRNS